VSLTLLAAAAAAAAGWLDTSRLKDPRPSAIGYAGING